MDIKGLLADQMGHFTPYDMGGALLCVLLAALLAFVLVLLAGRGDGMQPRMLAAFAAVVALAVALVRASVPLSIALVAVAMLARSDKQAAPADGTAGHARLLRLAAAAIGLGCGSSAGLVTAVLMVPVALLLRWAFTRKAA